MDRQTISLIVLTWNEFEGVTAILPRLLAACRDQVDEIFAVDGGSSDGTLDIFQKHGIPVHPQVSRGRGEGIRLGVERAQSTHVVLFSPDGNENPEDIPKFRPYFEQGYDLVIASRMTKGAYNEEDSQLLRPRKWANNLFNLSANVLFRRQGPYITDSINGFRGFRRQLLGDLGVTASGYTIEYQMTIRALKSRCRIVEFPTYESSRIAGETKAPSFRTGIQFLNCLKDEILR